MKLRFVLPTLALALVGLVSTSAQAQIGVYLNPVFNHISTSTADSGPFSFLGDGVTSRWFGGVDYGGYWDFYHATAFSAGLDVRETIVHSNNAKLNTFSVAARIAGNPKYGFRPYAQLAVGAGHSKPEQSTLGVTKVQFGIYGGLDYPIAKHVDFRVIEIGYGSVTPMSSEIERVSNCITTFPTPGGSPVTTCSSIPSVNLIHISSGLVFRFGK